MNIPSLPDTFAKMMVAVGIALVAGFSYAVVSQVTSFATAVEQFSEQVDLSELDTDAWLEDRRRMVESTEDAAATKEFLDRERKIQQQSISNRHTASRLHRRAGDVQTLLFFSALGSVVGWMLIVDGGRHWRRSDERLETLQQLQLASAIAEQQGGRTGKRQRKGRA